MKVGLIYPQNELGGSPIAVREIGLAADAQGFHFLVAYDHVLGADHAREPKLNGPYTDRDPFHDPFVMFGYLAAITRQIELVTGVLILPQRQTVLVARQAADLDLLCNGRFRLGAGTGWNHVEYDAMGQDFETRGSRLSEQVELLRTLWAEPLVSFDGRFDRVDRAALNPRPRRRIPIWLGGFADVALRRAARIADGFICADGAADAVAQLNRLNELLEQAGRSRESFGFQCNMLKAKTPEAVVETALRWRDAGGTHAAFHTMGQSLGDLRQHLDYINRVGDALRTANLISQ